MGNRKADIKPLTKTTHNPQPETDRTKSTKVPKETSSTHRYCPGGGNLDPLSPAPARVLAALPGVFAFFLTRLFEPEDDAVIAYQVAVLYWEQIGRTRSRVYSRPINRYLRGMGIYQEEYLDPNVENIPRVQRESNES